ncbi:MAG: DUF4129 domain-containing protein, partial [Planctomycetota bacterium]
RERNPRPLPAASSGGSSDGFAWLGAFKVLGWVLLIAVLGLMFWMLLGWWGNQRRVSNRATPSRATLDSALEQRDALAADAEEWAAHAQTLAEEQDLRQAFRAMFLSLLSGLHSAGHIRYRAQRTNWTYVRGFSGPDPQRDAFGELTHRFDDVWYGHREPQAEEFSLLRQRVASLLGAGGPKAGGGKR